jgi:lipid-A-disaccharide synthase-like uncharacterized protein
LSTSYFQIFSSLLRLSPQFVDGLGWLGAAAVVVPYALVSIGRLSGTSLAFAALNVFGGVLLLLNTWYHEAYPSSAVNVVWTAIGLYAIARSLHVRYTRGHVTKP